MTDLHRPESIPPLATFTVDVAGNERRFMPFAHGTAPDPDQAAVRAMNAVAARAAVELVGTTAGRLAAPVAIAVAFATATLLARAASTTRGNDGALLALLAGYVVGAGVHALIRQRCVWRHRGLAARLALLTLGRCGACGYLLRGAKLHVSTGEKETLELCQCGECGGLWVAEAREHPRHAVTHARVDLPECGGLDAARARMRLRRALRAAPSDFIADAAGEPRYVAHMDGAHRTGAAAFARDLLDTAGAALLSIIGALVVFGCCGNILGALIRAILLADPRDATSAAMAIGAEAALALGLSILGFAGVSRYFTPRHRALQSRRFLANGECPCCTMTLPAPCEDGLARCTCCEAAWRP